MARLRPMRDDEYDSYVRVLKDAYVEDIVGSGTMGRADAEAKADADLEAQLPLGVQTPNAHLFVLEDDGEAVGYAWMADQPDQVGKRIAFVYDVWIRPDARGRGLGRAAMLAVEDEARRLGLDRIRLNVFGQNEVARKLYMSLGYAELSVFMGKTLDL